LFSFLFFKNYYKLGVIRNLAVFLYQRKILDASPSLYQKGGREGSFEKALPLPLSKGGREGFPPRVLQAT